MTTFTTKLRLILPIEVEADSQAAAEAMVDNIVNNCQIAAVYQNRNAFDRFLYGKPERLERDDITEQEEQG